MKSVEDYIGLKPIKADHRLHYGKNQEQFGDLYLPASTTPSTLKHPTIVLMHGGCWQAQHDLSKLGQLSKALTTLGFAVWNLEFRRLGNGGGWPVTFEDVTKGTDFLTSVAEKHSLDISSVTAMGHSAGGHLALWLAGRHHLSASSMSLTDQSIRIQKVVSLAGIPDLVEGVKQNICRGSCQELVGGLPDEVPELYQQASPHYLLPLNIPQWHLVGELDPIVPADYLTPYINKAKKYDEVYFEVIPNIGHFEMVMPDSISWSYIKNALQSS